MSAGKSSRLLAAGFVTAIFILTAVLVWSPQVFADSTVNASWGISGYSTKPGDGTGPSFGGAYVTYSSPCIPRLPCPPPGNCQSGNPHTGQCSCPAGYWAQLASMGPLTSGCSASEYGSGCTVGGYYYGYICVK